MNHREGLRLASRLLTAAVLSATSLAGWAGPPFRTDDPDADGSEFIVFYQQTLAADGRTGVLPAFEYNYKLEHQSVQLHLVAPVAFSTPSGQRTSRGYGDTELGVKWQFKKFHDEDDMEPTLGIFPLVEVPTGNSDRELGNGHTQVFIPLWVQWKRDVKWDESKPGEFKTYGGGGYWVNNGPGNRNYWFVGWAAEYKFTDSMTLGAEIFHTTGQVIGQSASTGFNVGGCYEFDQGNLLFSVGKGLQNAADTNRVSAYIGYQLKFNSTGGFVQADEKNKGC
jgi:hypothetical protein